MLKKVRTSLFALAIAGAALFGSTASFAAQAAQPVEDTIIIIICDDLGCDIIVIETR